MKLSLQYSEALKDSTCGATYVHYKVNGQICHCKPLAFLILHSLNVISEPCPTFYYPLSNYVNGIHDHVLLMEIFVFSTAGEYLFDKGL